LAGVQLPNPVMTASGCAGSGRELDQFFDVSALGALVTRSITLDPRAGHPGPRIVETPSGVLGSIGLQGTGVDGFLATDLPWLAQRRARAVVSIAGSTLGEYGELARRVGNSSGVTAVEVNLDGASPAVRERSFSWDPFQAARVASVVRRDVPRGIPVLVKLSPDVTSIVDVADAVVEAGADGLVLLNTALGVAVDPGSLRPTLAGVTGGLSGPAIRPLAVRCVWQVHQAMPDVPIVGVGGIRSGFDALEFLLAGASAVQVGTVVFHDPSAPMRIVDQLREELSQRGITAVADTIGRAHRPEGEQL
ncbi:MAG: dihydroorotate dehydrogenase, partial [Pseudonocardia sp.]